MCFFGGDDTLNIDGGSSLLQTKMQLQQICWFHVPLPRSIIASKNYTS
jgi:hypothetical protein